MTAHETRIFPLTHSVSAEYAIVSMPRTTWYWLDDMISYYYPSGGYHSFIHDMGADNPDDLVRMMSNYARSYCEEQMADLYGLANDNERIFPRATKPNPGHPNTPDYSTRMPCVYQLFRFMPHATYLTTVWERRNYHLQGDFL